MSPISVEIQDQMPCNPMNCVEAVWSLARLLKRGIVEIRRHARPLGELTRKIKSIMVPVQTTSCPAAADIRHAIGFQFDDFFEFVQ